MIGKNDIAIIAATVTASTQDFRWLAQSMLKEEIERERKDQGCGADQVVREALTKI